MLSTTSDELLPAVSAAVVLNLKEALSKIIGFGDVHAVPTNDQIGALTQILYAKAHDFRSSSGAQNPAVDALMSSTERKGDRNTSHSSRSSARRLTIPDVASPTTIPTISPAPTACFEFVMEDSYGDGWQGAIYTLRDAETNIVIQTGALDDGDIATDAVCIDGTGCYTLQVSDDQFNNEISWSFGGTVSGTSPYGPAELWADDDGALTTGTCPTPSPTPSPTLSLSPTPEPSSQAPTATRSPTSIPTPAPTPSPTATVYFEAETFFELRTAVQVSHALVNVSVAVIVLPTQISVSKSVAIFSTCNATLRANGGRHFYLSSGARLRLEGLTLKNGAITDDSDGGGSIFVLGGHLDVSRTRFEGCSTITDVAGSSLDVYGGTICLTSAATANFRHCRFVGSSSVSDDDAYGGTVALRSSSIATFLSCRFESSTVHGSTYSNAYGGTVALMSSSTATFQNCRFDGSTATAPFAYGENIAYGGVVYLVDSTCAFVLCSFSDCTSDDYAGAMYIEASQISLDRSTFTQNQANTEAGALKLVSASSCDISECTFHENQAPTAGVCAIDASSSLSIDASLFASNLASTGNGGVFSGKVTASDSAFVNNTAFGSGGVLSGAGDFVSSNFSTNTAAEGDGGTAHLFGGGSSFVACVMSSGFAPLGKGAFVYSTADASITASSVQGFQTPNSAYIIDHEPSGSSISLALDRVAFQGNSVAAVHSTATVAIRNCVGLSNSDDVDVPSDLLISCSSSGAGSYCAAEYCADALEEGTATHLGLQCYCQVNGVALDPKLSSCANGTEITPAPSATPNPTPHPTNAPTHPTAGPTAMPTPSPTLCFDFVMVDSYGDGWDDARYWLRSVDTNNVVASGTLGDGYGGTESLCLGGTGCYAFQITSGTGNAFPGQWDGEISWSFGGTLSGGAPYGPANMWVGDGGVLETGDSCPTPSPTMSFVPTPAPTVTQSPSLTPVPSRVPSQAPTPSPNVEVTYFEASNSWQLSEATRVPNVVIEVTVDEIEISEQIEINGNVTIFSSNGALLNAAQYRCRHFYVLSGSRLRLEGLALGGGYMQPSPGGAVYAENAHLEVSNTVFKENGINTYNDPTLAARGGAVALVNTIANFVNCSFEGNSAYSKTLGMGDGIGTHGGAVALVSSSTIFHNCWFGGNRIRGEYVYGGAVALEVSSSANFLDCQFEGNTATTLYAPSLLCAAYGGDVAVGVVALGVDADADDRSTANFENCRFDSSAAQTTIAACHAYGGSVSMIRESTGIFSHCSFTGTESDGDGGALNVEFSDATLYDSTFLNSNAVSLTHRSTFLRNVRILFFFRVGWFGRINFSGWFFL